jgi:hypothetical protein
VLDYPFIHIRFSWYDRESPGGVLRPSARYAELVSTDKERNQNIHASITISYAGLPAEQLLHANAPECHGDYDIGNIEVTCQDCSYRPDLVRLRGDAKRLVKRNKTAIRHLALVIFERLMKMPDDQKELIVSQQEVKDILSGVTLYNTRGHPLQW